MDQKPQTENFSKLATLKDVASLLAIPPKTLSFLLYCLPKDKQYTEFLLRKKNGETRSIHVPCAGLKKIQKKLNEILQVIFWENYEPRRKYIYGFLSNQHIRDNALCHKHKKYVINLDLKDFFGQITFPRVRGLFMNYPFQLPAKAATVLAHLTTWNFSLPQGAPTSPIISNLICARLDGTLWKFARENHCFYSRYADDITFSTGKNEIPSALGILSDGVFQLSPKLRKIIEQDNNFAINDKKTRCMSRYNRQEVTGLTVNDKVNVSHRYIKQIRAMLYDWDHNGEDAALATHLSKRTKHNKPEQIPSSFRNIVGGKLLFIKQICGEKSSVYRQFKFQFDLLIEAPEPIIVSRNKKYLSMGVYIIEDQFQNKCFQGTGFLLAGIGLITNAHVLSDARNDQTRNIPCFEDGIEVYQHPKTKTFRVKYCKSSIENDFAILSLLGTPCKPCFEYSEEPIIERQRVYIAGYPNYSCETVSWIEANVVSQKTLLGTDYYCIDKGIVSGNSGGPVFNERLEVIGIATRGGEDLEEAEHCMSAFIPIHYVIDAQKAQETNE